LLLDLMASKDEEAKMVISERMERSEKKEPG
jgi:hypothetical protein